jgi:peptide chain release factor 2
LKKLEEKTLQRDFWSNPESAAKIQQEISVLKEDIEAIEKIEIELDVAEDLQKTEKEIEKQEFKIFLSGKYDKNNAILEIYSGVGGQDSQDWATMLLRMYEKYCATKNWKTNILHQSFGEAGGPDGRIGTKSVTIEIKGIYVYGFLKKETGVHRLVRQSPFNAKSLRQTSFALVNVLPEIDKDFDFEIKLDDLRVDTFKSSGPGGQYVNKTESAIRITHIPTGIVVSSQSERMQQKNRENAMKILYGKIYQLKEDQHAKELKDIKGEAISASWGNQIRSYVLHPYKMVKDLRTQYETSDTESVLNGNLEKFIEAELKLKDND